MEQTLNLNQNATDCVRSVYHFGSTTVMNICNSKIVEVPWGGMDWVFAILLIALCLGFTCLLLFPLWIIAFDY